MYWTRTSAEERRKRRSEIVQALREQHSETDAPSAHPQIAFNLPEWAGEPSASAAALIGNAPSWATV